MDRDYQMIRKYKATLTYGGSIMVCVKMRRVWQKIKAKIYHYWALSRNFKLFSRDSKKLTVSITISFLLIGGIVAGVLVWRKNGKVDPGFGDIT